MAIYCGTDITSIDRIKDSITEFGDTFLNRIYTDLEIEYCESKNNSKYQSYAARFAAKEAVYKAFSTLLDEQNKTVSWKDIEIINKKSGKPIINLSGYLADVLEENKIEPSNIDISLSHDAKIAIATIVVCSDI